jgi:hypothetical protein
MCIEERPPELAQSSCADAVRYVDRCAINRPTAREQATVPATNLASGLERMPLRRVRRYPRSMASRLCLHHDFRVAERRGGCCSRVTAVRTSIAGRAYRRTAGVTSSVRVMPRSRTCSSLVAGESLASLSMEGLAIASSMSMSPLAPSAMMAARITRLTGSPSAA